MILPIYIYGQPVLRKVAEDITPDYPNLKQLIENMFETMDRADGCGLAAPQIGLPIRVVVIDEPVKRPTKIRVQYLDEEFKEHDEWVEGFEACCMQHEFDHLEGKMFIDHLSALRKQMIKGKLNNMLKGNIRCSYKTKTVK